MNTIFTTPPTVLIATRSRLLLLSTMGSPRLFTAMVLVFLARGSLSQSQTNLATNLYIGMMRTTVTTGTATFYDPNVLILTESPTNSTISITRADGTVESTGVTNVKTPADLLLAKNLITLDGTVRENGVLVTSNDAPVSAVVYPYDFQGVTDAYLALPCQDVLIGRSNYEYFAVAFEGVPSAGYHSEILLVGCRANTNITITPTQTITIPSDLTAGSSSVTLSPGQSHSFSLGSQETFLITSTTSDLTGTRIVSDKPLTVTSGNDCAKVPLVSEDCEYVVEQIPPTATWGNEFVLVPFRGRETGQYYKIVSSKDNTLLKLTCKNDSLTRELTLPSAGDFQFFFTAASVYCSLESNNPILVVQVALSHGGDSKGDPIMILVAPLDEFIPSVNFQSLRFIGTFKHYVNVMVSDDHFKPAMILYDNATNSADCSWQPVFGSTSSILGWGCNFEIAAGELHNMRHTSPDGLLFVMVYGFRELTSVNRAYGYPAGLALDYHLRTVTFTSSSYMVAEDDGFIMIQLQNQGITTDTVIVHLQTTNQTSKPGEDYNATSMDIEFASDDIFKTVKIPITNDNRSEPIETFLLTLTSSPNSPNPVTVTPIHMVVVTIEDDDVINFDVAVSQTDSTANVLMVDVAIVSGILQRSLYLPILLTVETPSGSETEIEVEFSNYVTKLVVQFDISRLIPMSTANERLEFIASLTSRDTTGINVGPIPSSVAITRIPSVAASPTVVREPIVNGTYRIDSASSPVWITVILASVIILALIIAIVIVSVSCYYLGRRVSEHQLMYHDNKNRTSVTVTEILESHDNKAYHSSATNHTFGFVDDSNV